MKGLLEQFLMLLFKLGDGVAFEYSKHTATTPRYVTKFFAHPSRSSFFAVMTEFQSLILPRQLKSYRRCYYSMRLSGQRASWLAQLRTDASDPREFLSLEDFEERCIEPIIALQKTMLLDYLVFKGSSETPAFHLYKSEEKVNVIKSLLKDDVCEQSYLVGLIAGLFSRHEFLYFATNRKAVNNRIIRNILKLVKTERFLL